MSRTREGTTDGVFAYALWGLFPLWRWRCWHEPFGPARAVGFSLVWLALMVLSVDVVRHHLRTVAVAAC